MAGERKQSRHHDEPLLLPCGGKRRGPAAQVAALHLFLWSDSNQGGPLLQGRSLQYISASIGKLLLWVEQPVNYLVPILNGQKVFLGSHALVVYEMSCWIMLWQLSIPRQLQTGPFINRGSEIQEELQATRLRLLAAFMSAPRLEYQTSWPQVKDSAPPMLYIDYCIICSPLLLCNWVSEQKHN